MKKISKSHQNSNKETIKYKYLALNKMLRNKVPSLTVKEGGKLYYKVLDGKERISSLRKKLVEEANEVLMASNDNEILEEVGDVLDVVDALIKAVKLNKKDITISRKAKRKYRGSFSKAIYADYVRMPIDANAPWIKKYPEIDESQITKIIKSKRYKNVVSKSRNNKTNRK